MASLTDSASLNAVCGSIIGRILLDSLPAAHYRQSTWCSTAPSAFQKPWKAYEPNTSSCLVLLLKHPILMGTDTVQVTFKRTESYPLEQEATGSDKST
jgi:hypothetical protein